MFGRILGCWQVGERVFQSVAFILGIADVVVRHQVDAIQLRITLRKRGDARKVLWRGIDPRNQWAAQSQAGALTGEEIQVGKDQIVGNTGQFFVGIGISGLVIKQEEIHKWHDLFVGIPAGPTASIQAGVNSFNPGGFQ